MHPVDAGREINERCVFCWRDHAGHAYELGDVEWDDPAAVADASVELQRKLLSGFGGNDEVPREVFDQAMEPRHVAISLDGEPTLYPHLPELIEEFHDRESPGQRPYWKTQRRRGDPTQLYAPSRRDDRRRHAVQAMEDDVGRTSTSTCWREDDARTVTGDAGQGRDDDHPEWYAATV